MLKFSSDSPVNTVMLTGTLASDSSRLRADTVMVSKVSASAAVAVAAAVSSARAAAECSDDAHSVSTKAGANTPAIPRDMWASRLISIPLPAAWHYWLYYFDDNTKKQRRQRRILGRAPSGMPRFEFRDHLRHGQMPYVQQQQGVIEQVRRLADDLSL